MGYLLLHNPRCSKSRSGLALLRDSGIEPEIRLYMSEESQLTETELRDIAKKLGAKSPREFWRAKEAREAGLNADSTDDEIFAAMAKTPRMIERPIGMKGNKAVVGRPNENLLEIV